MGSRPWLCSRCVKEKRVLLSFTLLLFPSRKVSPKMHLHSTLVIGLCLDLNLHLIAAVRNLWSHVSLRSASGCVKGKKVTGTFVIAHLVSGPALTCLPECDPVWSYSSLTTIKLHWRSHSLFLSSLLSVKLRTHLKLFSFCCDQYNGNLCSYWLLGALIWSLLITPQPLWNLILQGSKEFHCASC